MKIVSKPATACLIDGEHYLPNLKASLEEIVKKFEVKYLIFIGGTEKIGTPEDVKKSLPYKIFFANNQNKPDIQTLGKILLENPIHVVLDLSDEPIMDYMTRFEVASHVLFSGAIYQGSDFKFDPLDFKKVFTKPSLAIWGTGKRIGKTALGGFIGRTLKKNGFKPAIITLSRGGPDEPLVVEGDKIKVDTEYLLKIDAKGMHASSDCFEDALTAGVKTFGCRRCGGGMSGKAMVSLLPKGATMAEKDTDVHTIIIEGSGATVPEVKTDHVILAMDVTQPLEILEGYLTPLRILYADLIILSMCEEFLVPQKRINRIIKRILEIKPSVKIATTVLRPKPLSSMEGKNVFFANTLPSKAVPFVQEYLEKNYHCKIVGQSNNLSIRPKLLKELKKIKKGEVVATELKAAAIAVVAKQAHSLGLETVFIDNIPVLVDRGGNVTDLEKEILNFFRG